MDLVISFDTEDFATPEALDAAGWWADELSARGWCGSFQMVGEVVRLLLREERHDILAALARHEIGTHTDLHSVPPTHAAALEGLDLEEGLAWVWRNEAPCMQAILGAFGRVPVSFCKPGSSWAPATLLAHAAMGVKIFCDAPFSPAAGYPFWYAGLLNVRYDLEFDMLYTPDSGAEERFRATFGRLAEAAGDDGVVTLFTHPNMLVTRRFYDAAYYHGRFVPPGECPPAPLRSAGEIKAAKSRVRGALDWLARRPGLRIIDFATLYAERSRSRRDLAALLDERGIRPGQEGRLPLLEPDGTEYLAPAVFDSLDLTGWPILPEGFSGKAIFEQARRLAWTSGAAPKNVSIT